MIIVYYLWYALSENSIVCFVRNIIVVGNWTDKFTINEITIECDTKCYTHFSLFHSPFSHDPSSGRTIVIRNSQFHTINYSVSQIEIKYNV